MVNGEWRKFAHSQQRLHGKFFVSKISFYGTLRWFSVNFLVLKANQRSSQRPRRRLVAPSEVKGWMVKGWMVNGEWRKFAHSQQRLHGKFFVSKISFYGTLRWFSVNFLVLKANQRSSQRPRRRLEAPSAVKEWMVKISAVLQYKKPLINKTIFQKKL